MIKKLNLSPLMMTVASGIALIMVAGPVMGYQALTQESRLKKDLQADFPKTHIDSVKCASVISGLCEVSAGKNLFYASRDARYVVVGSLLDLKDKVDLTDKRLRELAAVDSATAPIVGTQAHQPAPATHIKIDLPLRNAVIHNPGAPVKVSVFSDYSCGYCRSFFAELAADKKVEVTEYPIAILGEDSETKARLVLCSRNRREASQAAYAGNELKTGGNCDAAAHAVKENTRFAKANGVNGTPTIVRTDGAINAGYLAPDALKAFAEARS